MASCGVCRSASNKSARPPELSGYLSIRNTDAATARAEAPEVRIGRTHLRRAYGSPPEAPTATQLAPANTLWQASRKACGMLDIEAEDEVLATRAPITDTTCTPLFSRSDAHLRDLAAALAACRSALYSAANGPLQFNACRAATSAARCSSAPFGCGRGSFSGKAKGPCADRSPDDTCSNRLIRRTQASLTRASDVTGHRAWTPSLSHASDSCCVFHLPVSLACPGRIDG